MDIAFTIGGSVVTGAVWLAYYHPSLYKKLASAFAYFIVLFVCVFFGVQIGVLLAEVALEELDPVPQQSLEAIKSMELPAWLVWSPAVIYTFLLFLKTFPAWGFTEEARHKELQKKLQRPSPRQ